MNENVIRFPNQNTLRTRFKEIRNPQKEISGGFFMIKFLLMKNIKFSLTKNNKAKPFEIKCCLFFFYY